MSTNNGQCSVVFNKMEFESIISSAKNSAESKTVLPILTTFLIEVNGARYSVKATDLENYVRIEGSPETTNQQCTVCVNSKKLIDIVKTLPATTLTMTLVEDNTGKGSYVQIQSGRSKFKLTLADASEFPAFPTIEEGMISNGILGAMLLEGLERTDYATAKDTTNPVLTGVYASFKNNNGKPLVEFASTDGSRLTVFKKYYPQDEQHVNINDVSFTIPKKTIKILKDLVNQTAWINIYYKPGGSFLVFEDKVSGWTLFSRLLEGEFPDYTMYIDQIERPIVAKAPTRDLKDFIKRLSVTVEGSVIPIKLTFADNVLVGETYDRELTEGKDEIDIEYTGSAFVVELNAKYLKDTIDYAPTDYVNISTDDPLNGILVSCGNLEEDGFYYASLIMPFG